MKKHNAHNNGSLGLWIYLMSDCLLFGALFVTYAVLHMETAGGVTGTEIFNRDFVLVETLVLLTSSFTCGLALISARAGKQVFTWLSLMVTLGLGALFIGMEVGEFSSLITEGNGPQASAFLSSFFTLVGTHGLHVFAGLLWILVLMGHLAMTGVNEKNADRIYLFSLFWHFLDIVWICLFSLVYLLGSLS